MLPLRLTDLRTVLCLGAHADDIEIGCGGLLHSLLSAVPALHVDWVVLGASDVRAEEARRSAERWLAGAASSTIVVHGFRDSYFPYHGREVKEFVESIRNRVAPDLILSHRGDDAHQDHRLVSELTRNAFRNHWILEYEIPKYDGDLGQPNIYVPLDSATCRKKIEMLRDGFPSQRDKDWFTDDTFWSLLRLRGVECHSPTRYAEAFYCRKMVLGGGALQAEKPQRLD